jgi:hypothetical protein
MVPVSSDNPYVGANLFLASEMERSSYLYNFLRAKGPPQALELTGSEPDALEVKMFYAKRRELFIGAVNVEKRGKTTVREWIVRGPYAIERDYARNVSRLPTSDHAVFQLWGQRETLGDAARPLVQSVINPAFVPTPTPRPTPRPRPKAPAVKATPAPTAVPMPMNFDQKAIQDYREMAERTLGGDVIHTVKSESETLTSLSNWYTGSPENAQAISEKNNLPLDTKLNPGAKVFIPSGIVTNPKTMK